MIPNEKELNRIIDKALDLIDDREVDYLIDTILYLQWQIKLFKELYHNTSNEADKQIEQLKEEAKQWSIVAHANREEIDRLNKYWEVAEKQYKDLEIKNEELEKQVDYWRTNYYVKAELSHEFAQQLDNIKDYCLGDKAPENTGI